VPEVEFARIIDHTLLKAQATPADVLLLCEEAVRYGFGAVCLNSAFVPLAAERLAKTGVAVCTVVGFPLGATGGPAKAHEAGWAVHSGATEIDMVIPVGLLKAGRDDLVEDDIRAVVAAARGSLVKVIIEACYLTDTEKVRACELAEKAGAHFVKTSTGFGPGGATVADIRLMRESIGPGLEVKASGGVRTRQAALDMIDAGATRIGTSSGVAIVQG